MIRNKNEDDIPHPDFSEDDSPQSNDSSEIQNRHHPRFNHFSLSIDCDPNKTFSTTTKNGIEYDIENPIFRNKSCTIFIGRKKSIFYALKYSNRQRRLKREWEVYQKVGDFPTIVRSFNFWDENDRYSFLQLEYASGGSISASLFHIERSEFWRVMAHISLALYHIHRIGYIHLDISPSNILQTIGKSNKVIYKLSDFGITECVGCSAIECEGSGPYVSPEALNPNAKYPVTTASDIWSFGAVLYEIACRCEVPRDDENYEAIRNGTFAFSRLPNEFIIVRSMMNLDPGLRPSAKDLIEIPKVKEILNELFEEIKNESDDFDEKDVELSSFYESDVDSHIQRRQSFDVI